MTVSGLREEIFHFVSRTAKHPSEGAFHPEDYEELLNSARASDVFFHPSGEAKICGIFPVKDASVPKGSVRLACTRQ